MRQIVFTMACRDEQQKKLIGKEIARIKKITGQLQASIVLEALRKLRGEK